MYFALDPAQRELQDSVRSWVEQHASESLVRATMATPDDFDATAWKSLGAGLGVLGLASDVGADTPGLVDAVAVLEVLAGALYPGPYLSTLVASAILTALPAGGRAASSLAALRSGELLIATAWPRTAGDRVTASGAGVLHGELAVVLDAATADRLLVCTGEAWYEVETDAAGLTIEAVHGFDQTRRLARVRLEQVPARVIPAAGAGLLRQAQLVERIGVAAENAGVARHCLDAGVAYARERQQFGRPIGAFQALQHWLADVALAVECAWGAAYQAAWDAEHRPEEAERSSLLAAATAGEAALAAAEQMLQLHGGVGFTWDNPAHLYLKRAKANRLLFGHPDVHRDRLGELLGL